MSEQIDTVWEVWTYDVWGNRKDGYEVNDRWCINRALELKLTVRAHNVGTPAEFKSAYPSARQIREALGLTGAREGIECDGDDMAVYVTYGDKPCGELICTSHQSLSPIKLKA